MSTALTIELSGIESELSRAIDIYATGDDAKGDHVAQKAIERLKPFLTGEHRRTALMMWGFALQLLRESEQALLRYEDILQEDSSDEEALWQCVKILLVDMENAASARKLLEERLLPIAAKDEYLEALNMARLALGERPSKDAAPKESQGH
jgi:hypothetical protein